MFSELAVQGLKSYIRGAVTAHVPLHSSVATYTLTYTFQWPHQRPYTLHGSN
jgi:hypothetical protein